MLVVYDSLTGNVDRFVKKLSMNSVRISSNLIVKEPYCLVTYTIGFGEVPRTTQRFLYENSEYLMGVASSGNLIWGDNFGKAADRIASAYHVPLIHKFELAGTVDDVWTFSMEVENIVKSNAHMDRAQ